MLLLKKSINWPNLTFAPVNLYTIGSVMTRTEQDYEVIISQLIEELEDKEQLIEDLKERLEDTILDAAS